MATKTTTTLKELYDINKNLLDQQAASQANLQQPKDQRIYVIRLTNAAASKTINRATPQKKFHLTNLRINYGFAASIGNKSIAIWDSAIATYSTSGKINIDLNTIGAVYNSENIIYQDPIIFTSPSISAIIGTPIGGSDQLTLEFIGFEQ